MKTDQSHLICLEEHRTFTEGIRKRFSDTSKYRISVVSSQNDLLKHFEGEKEQSHSKVAIIVMGDQADLYEKTEHLALEIKRTDSRAGIILICPGDKTDEIKKKVKFNIDAFIPKNVNAILRLHNAVKKHVSGQNLIRIRKRRNISMIILLAFLLLAAMMAIIVRLKFPFYF